MNFSERFGFKSIKDKIQDKSMDTDLKNSIWNALKLSYFDIENISYESYLIQEYNYLFGQIWVNHFKLTLDTLEDHIVEKYNQIKGIYFKKLEWSEIYDLIEFIVNTYRNLELNQKFIKFCNIIFKKELSAYRFVGTRLTKITSETEISEIEEALKIKDPFKPIVRHLNNSLKLFSDKKTPDYKNSIKESISAVEAMCQIITQNKKATLGDALKLIEKQGKIQIHQALKIAFNKLYGYTSNASGIRHGSGLMEDHDLDFEDAKFILVSCSAFINYLKEKVNKAKLKIKKL